MPSGYKSKLECKDRCEKRGFGYSWCNTDDGYGLCTEPLSKVIFKYVFYFNMAVTYKL